MSQAALSVALVAGARAAFQRAPAPRSAGYARIHVCVPPVCSPIPASRHMLESVLTVTGTADQARCEAFDRFVVPELKVLYRVALTLTREPHEAEDLVQDTVLKAFRAMHQFDGAHPRAWLMTILRNTHINRNRRRRPGLLRDPEALDALVDQRSTQGVSAEDTVLEGRFEAVVEAALQRLSSDHLRVILLVDVDGLTYQEAADVLAVPRGTVMSRLHRARARIRADLKTSGVTANERGAQ